MEMMMSDHSVTRRLFIGGLLAAIPVVRLAASCRRMLANEFTLIWGNTQLHPFHILTYTNGDIEVDLGGVSMKPRPSSGGWSIFECRTHDRRGTIRLRHGSEKNSLDIDWLKQEVSSTGLKF